MMTFREARRRSRPPLLPPSLLQRRLLPQRLPPRRLRQQRLQPPKLRPPRPRSLSPLPRRSRLDFEGCGTAEGRTIFTQMAWSHRSDTSYGLEILDSLKWMNRYVLKISTPCRTSVCWGARELFYHDILSHSLSVAHLNTDRTTIDLLYYIFTRMICAQRQTVSNRDQFREILNKLHLDERKRERRGLLSTAQLTLEIRPYFQLLANLIIMRLLA